MKQIVSSKVSHIQEQNKPIQIKREREEDVEKSYTKNEVEVEDDDDDAFFYIHPEENKNENENENDVSKVECCMIHMEKEVYSKKNFYNNYDTLFSTSPYAYSYYAFMNNCDEVIVYVIENDKLYLYITNTGRIFLIHNYFGYAPQYDVHYHLHIQLNDEIVQMIHTYMEKMISENIGDDKRNGDAILLKPSYEGSSKINAIHFYKKIENFLEQISHLSKK